MDEYGENNSGENRPKKSKPVDYSHFLQEEKETKEKTTKKSDISSFSDFRQMINDPQKKKSDIPHCYFNNGSDYSFNSKIFFILKFFAGIIILYI
jgi:hypothetical protein